MEGLFLVYIIAGIVWGVIWGFATNKVIENKGYSENWFWWGFFFGFIAFIVALTKSDAHRSQYSSSSSIAYIEPVVKSADTWKCGKCGRYNSGFSCDCGMLRGDNAMFLKKQAAEKAKAEAEAKAKQEQMASDQQELDNLKKIKEYKDLLDSGVISQEEFDAKKKQLLGL